MKHVEFHNCPENHIFLPSGFDVDASNASTTCFYLWKLQFYIDCKLKSCVEIQKSHQNE